MFTDMFWAPRTMSHMCQTLSKQSIALTEIKKIILQKKRQWSNSKIRLSIYMEIKCRHFSEI